MSKTKKNFQEITRPISSESEKLLQRMEKICVGLIYVSEVDSPVTVFVGPGVGSLLQQVVEHEPGKTVSEIDFRTFFDRLTTPKDWHGEREAARSEKFLDLQKLIEESLREPKVFKIGVTHVRYVAGGTDVYGRAVGVSITALET